jgi:Cytidine deaminase
MVGAALLCDDGSVYTGCNIENAAYSPTICAERVAIFKAVSDGKRGFIAIAIAGGAKETAEETLAPCYPCGVCRQVLAEFCQPELAVITAEGKTSLRDLLPHSFRL